MSLIEVLDPRKKAWWRKGEWAKVDEWTVSYTKDRHDCPSWDVGFCNLEKYQHKDRCDVRIKVGRDLDLFSKTVFEDPTQNNIKCLHSEVDHISNYSLYEGPKYE